MCPAGPAAASHSLSETTVRFCAVARPGVTDHVAGTNIRLPWNRDRGSASGMWHVTQAAVSACGAQQRDLDSEPGRRPGRRRHANKLPSPVAPGKPDRRPPGP